MHAGGGPCSERCEEGVKAAVDELLQGGVELGDVEVVAEGAPASGVEGLQEGDIDGEGVVDGIILEIGGFDARYVVVMA